MLKFERERHPGSPTQRRRIRDFLCVPHLSASEAEEALRNGGFFPCGHEIVSDESNGEDDPSGQRIWTGTLTDQATVPMKLWSSDEDGGGGVGFACRYHTAKSILYAKLTQKGVTLGERSLKGAITSLFDVAEACSTRRITIGLGAEHSTKSEYVCSLLYLGFQVVPPRKCPLANVALMLDFDMGWPPSGHASSDHTCTSDCSTSAEENGLDSESPDSD